MMQLTNKQTGTFLALVVVMTLALACPAMAEKPAWAGGGDKNEKHEKKEKSKGKKGHEKGSAHFSDHHREVIRTYYQDQFRAGSCPPGLAKKNNGCLPPGQAKKWVVGQPLSRDIIVYDLPQVIITQLGPPPVGHYYVRVDADILLLTVGTMMVVDALQNLTGN